MPNDELSIDLSNFKDRVGQRVAPGRYTVVVDDAEPDTSKASGNPMVNLWFRVIGGEFDGATIIDRLVITEKSLFRVVGFMQALGLPTPKKRLKVNLRQFIGKSLLVDVEDGEPYRGRVKSEVRGYLQNKAAGAQQTTNDDLDDLDDFTETPAPEETPSGPAEAVETDEFVDLDSVDL